jgi:hypothetical protein
MCSPGVRNRTLRGKRLAVLVHYFTARVRNNPTGGVRQQTYLDALQTRPRVLVHEGRFQSKHQECRSCGKTWQAYEEKETDVAIASSFSLMLRPRQWTWR